ncbi:MAG: EAL domain-containing protein [Acetobacteraceae bacterium]|nr:EAL domain-containing protein [Acetobacteraceae bacterium]
MRLRTVFLLCFAAASLPALGWSVWTAADAWARWSHATAAVRAAEAMGQALYLVEALSVERGALQERSLSDGPGVENLADIAARNDALLDRAQRSLRAADLPDEAVTKAREILGAARARVAEAVRRPLAERDPALVPDIMAQLYDRLGAVEAAVALAEGATARASASVGALVEVGSLAVDMRAAAGRRSSHLSGWVGGRPLTQRQIEDLTLLTGQIQHAWDRLRRQVAMTGSPPRLVAAMAATRDGFFREAEPVYRSLAAVARAGGKPPLSLRDWRRWTIAALPGVLPARDAAVAEAVAHGSQIAAGARTRLFTAVGAIAAALGLAAAALLVLLGRLVLPVQRLTASVARLAAGDVKARVPGLGRRDEVGEMAAAVEVFRENALALGRTNLRFAAALDNMPHGLAMYDAEDRLVVMNARLCETIGLPPGSVQPGMTLREVMGVCMAAGHFPGRTLDEVCAERRIVSPQTPAESASFEEVRGDKVLAVSAQLMVGGGCVFTLEDVTERRQAEARIAHMAHHDALTGLPNRVLFRARLEDALARTRRGEAFALLCLDLDRFKSVNDTLGHAVGDALLRAVTARLRAALRGTDVLARLGGDEFAVLLPAMREPSEAADLARRLVEALSAPCEVEGHQVLAGASVGIAVARRDGSCPDTLLKNADLALYRAKADGRAAWRFFEPEMDARTQGRRRLELGLRHAVAEGEFELHYQPVVDPRTRRPTGFEALLRWNRPGCGVVSPAEFVPVAEDVGLIVPIGTWALRRACAEAARWPDGLRVAVNLSPAQFRAGEALIDTIADALAASGLARGRLEVEITEGVMLQDTEETLATLRRIRALGVAVAMDDFGTGYSSLGYLRRFPFDKVKVDRSFVQGLDEGGGGDCAAIVRAVTGLCAGLGVATTAEGVETERQLAYLTQEGCTEVQGFLFSRPVSAAEVPSLLARPLGVMAVA